MELDEVPTGHERATFSLKVLLLVFAVVLVGALGYMVWAQNTTLDTTDNSAAVTKKTMSTTTPAKTTTTTRTAAPVSCSTMKTYQMPVEKLFVTYPACWNLSTGLAINQADGANITYTVGSSQYRVTISVEVSSNDYSGHQTGDTVIGSFILNGNEAFLMDGVTSDDIDRLSGCAKTVLCPISPKNVSGSVSYVLAVRGFISFSGFQGRPIGMSGLGSGDTSKVAIQIIKSLHY